MGNTVHFAGVSGSLRKGSYNTALLHCIMDELLPDDTTMEILIKEKLQNLKGLVLAERTLKEMHV